MKVVKQFIPMIMLMIIVSVAVPITGGKTKPNQNVNSSISFAKEETVNLHIEETQPAETVETTEEQPIVEERTSDEAVDTEEFTPGKYADIRMPDRSSTQIYTNTQEVKQEQTPEPAPEQTQVVEEINTQENYTAYNEKYVPSGRGRTHTIMAWQFITARSKQLDLINAAGRNYDANGFGRIDDRYVVAVKPYYGKIGDYLDVIKSNGSIIKCIVGDSKGSDGGGDQYMHRDGSIVEFCVDKYKFYSKYNGLGRYRTVIEFHPEWDASIDKIIHVGNYWD